MLRLVALLNLALLACVAPAAAQAPIHRCIGANGGAVFTDQPCAALRATPVNPTPPSADTPAPSGPPPVLCAAGVEELRQSVIDAFARRDSVRMGGLILWDGYGRGAAIADIRALTELMKQPLLQVDLPAPATSATAPPDDWPPFASDAAPAPTATPGQLVLHTAGADGTGSTWRFDVVRQAGCLWLRNAQSL